VLVIGPGLGREFYMQEFAKLAISLAKEKCMFLVLDADALWLVGQDVSIIKGYRRAILTPNVVEFSRLIGQVGINPDAPSKERANLMSQALGGVTILEKGKQDLVAVNTTSKEGGVEAGGQGEAGKEKEAVKEVVEVDVEGGMKRCGGQGDILSGCVGTFLAWAKCYEDGAFGDKSVTTSRMPLLAAVGGSMVTRTASRRAFFKEGRGVVTEDMVPEIGKAFAHVFGEEHQEQDKGKL